MWGAKKEAIYTRPWVWVSNSSSPLEQWQLCTLLFLRLFIRWWWHSPSYLPSPVYTHTWKKVFAKPTSLLVQKKYKRFPLHLHIWRKIISIFPDLADYAQTQSNIWELSQATHWLEQHSSNQYILLTFQVRTEEAQKLLSLVSVNSIWQKDDSLYFYSIFRYSVPIKANKFLILDYLAWYD